MIGGSRSKASEWIRDTCKCFSTATVTVSHAGYLIPRLFRDREEETVRSAAKPSREDKWEGERNEGNEISAGIHAYRRRCLPVQTADRTRPMRFRHGRTAGTKLKTDQPFATANTFYPTRTWRTVSFLFSELP